MPSTDQTTGRDIVIALLLLSGISVGGPLLFPESVTVAESGLLLGAVFAALIVVSVVARLSNSSMGIGRVLLLSVVLGTLLWGLQLVQERRSQAESGVAFAEAVARFEAEAGMLEADGDPGAAGRPAPPRLDVRRLGDRSMLPEYTREMQTYLAWAEDAGIRHLETLDLGIAEVRDAAARSGDAARERLRDFEGHASRTRDYWQRYWDTEVQASGIMLELLELLHASSYMADVDAGVVVFERATDQLRYGELSSRLAEIREAQALDRQEFERYRMALDESAGEADPSD